MVWAMWLENWIFLRKKASNNNNHMNLKKGKIDLYSILVSIILTVVNKEVIKTDLSLIERHLSWVLL